LRNEHNSSFINWKPDCHGNEGWSEVLMGVSYILFALANLIAENIGCFG
jgi:hypothetical protein